MSLIVTTFGDGTPIASVRPVKRRSHPSCAPQIVRGCLARAWPEARRGAVLLALLSASLHAGAVDLNLRSPAPAAAAAAEGTIVLAGDRHTVARAKLVMDSRDAAAKCRKLAADSRMHCERAAQEMVASRGVAPDSSRPVSAATPPAPSRAATAKPRYAAATQ